MPKSTTTKSPALPRNAAERAACFTALRMDNDGQKEREDARLRSAFRAEHARHGKRADEIAAEERAAHEELGAELATEFHAAVAPIIDDLREDPTRPKSLALMNACAPYFDRCVVEIGAEFDLYLGLACAFAESEVRRRPAALGALGAQGALFEPGGASVLDFARRAAAKIAAGDIAALLPALQELESAVIAAGSRARVPDDEARKRLDAEKRHVVQWLRSAEREKCDREIAKEHESAAVAQIEAERLQIIRFRAGEDPAEGRPPEWQDAADRLSPDRYGPLLRHRRPPPGIVGTIAAAASHVAGKVKRALGDDTEDAPEPRRAAPTMPDTTTQGLDELARAGVIAPAAVG